MTIITSCQSSNYTYCSDLQDLVAIDRDTTPEKFNFMHANYQKKQEETSSRKDMFLMQDKLGYPVLHQAIKLGNIPLTKYIVNLRGKELLSLPNAQGLTALHCAIESQEKDEMIETLLELDAPVNRQAALAADSYPYMYVYEELPPTPPATPLWYAAQVAYSVRMCKILLKYSAVAAPVLDEQGTGILKEAQRKLTQEEIPLTSGLKSWTPMAFVVIEIVKGYLGYHPHR